MSRDWHEGYDFCDGSNHGDDGSDNGKQGNLVNIRSENADVVIFRYKDNKEGRMNSVFYLILQVN